MSSPKFTQHDTVTLKSGVKIPVLAILLAIPAAVQASRESASDNRDDDSPGGMTVTPGEVAEDVGAFFLALAEAVLPQVLAAHSR